MTAGGRPAEGHGARGVHRDDPGGGAVPAEVLRAAHQRSRRPGPDERVVDMTDLLQDRPAGAVPVRLRPGRVGVLVQPVEIGIAEQTLADVIDARLQIAAVGVPDVDDHHFGAEDLHQAPRLGIGVGVRDTGQWVALCRAHHRQGDAEVSRRRLDQPGPWKAATGILGRRYQRDGGLQLYRTGRIETFQFEED